MVSLFMPQTEKPQVYQSLLSFEDKDGQAGLQHVFQVDNRRRIGSHQGVAQISPLKDYYTKGEI